MKDFNRCMYDHTLHHGRKHFCSLQTFSTEKILKPHINDYFKIIGKEMIQMPKEGKYIINSKTIKEKENHHS